MPTPRGRYGATLAAITTLVEGLERESGEPARVGIGMPGALSPATGLVKNANSVWLNGRPLRQDLERLLHRPLRFANDANCFALSEARDGAGAGAPVVFGVILGTGTGGGIVVHGRVLGGPNAIAGEWGHNPLPWPRSGEWPGAACYCGRTGCVETFLSGPGRFPRPSRGHGRGARRDRPSPRGPPTATPRCEATLARYEERLARALAAVVNLLDPDVIVLGRRPLEPRRRLYERVPQRWGAWVFSDRVDTPLRPPTARRLERRPRGRVALGRRRGRREAEPVAAAYRLTPAAAWPTRSSGRSSAGRGTAPHLPPHRSGPSNRPGASTPVTLVERDGQRWLVAPYGTVGWVRNARAAGRVDSRPRAAPEPVIARPSSRRRTRPRSSASTRGRCRSRAPSSTQGPDSPVEAFAAEAARHPVFRITRAARERRRCARARGGPRDARPGRSGRRGAPRRRAPSPSSPGESPTWSARDGIHPVPREGAREDRRVRLGRAHLARQRHRREPPGEVEPVEDPQDAAVEVADDAKRRSRCDGARTSAGTTSGKTSHVAASSKCR